MKTEIAITGMGILGPSGATTASFWDALLHAPAGAGAWPKRPLSGYPVDNVAAMAEDAWSALGLAGPGARAKGLAEFTVAQALETAGLSPAKERIGCMLATTTAGVEAFEDLVLAQGDGLGWRDIDASASVPTMAAPWRAPAAMLSTACSSGLLAPAMAIDVLRSGEADAMVAGGLDVLLEYTVCGFNGLKLATPQRCQPFDAGRRGVLLSEGAVALCLESVAHARARRAPIRALISGVGLSCDAQHVTAPQAEGIARAMRQALDEAGLTPAEIGAVFAHGTGTQVNDLTEAEAMRLVWGDTPLPPVTAIKSVMGHPQAAAGAFALLAGVLSLQMGWVPPVAHLNQVDPAVGDLPVVTGAGERLQRSHVMVNAFGFGGNNCVMVVSDPAGAREDGDARH